MPATFLHYRLNAETLCLGERTRGGTFRPCASVFSYTSLVGALKQTLNIDSATPLHASALFIQEPKREIFTFAPRDRARGVSTLPLQVEYLVGAEANLYILQSEGLPALPESFSFSMGALRSKGLGHCFVSHIGEHRCDRPRKGRLCLRLPEDQDLKKIFGVGGISALRYGYLFNSSLAMYVKSLFEGSELHAYDVILHPEGLL